MWRLTTSGSAAPGRRAVVPGPTSAPRSTGFEPATAGPSERRRRRHPDKYGARSTKDIWDGRSYYYVNMIHASIRLLSALGFRTIVAFALMTIPLLLLLAIAL